MESTMKTFPLEDIKIPMKIRIAALWTSVMFCYVYGDYFELYVPGKLQDMLQGKMGTIGGVTQGMLICTLMIMAVPSLMIFLSLALPPAISRWLNVVVGLLYTLLVLATLFDGGWAFYMLMAGVEAVLTSLIVWSAWRWPRVSVGSESLVATSDAWLAGQVSQSPGS